MIHQLHGDTPQAAAIGHAQAWPTPAQARREQATADRMDPAALSETLRDRVPARCEYLDATHARVSHPLGTDHSNCQLLIARLLKRNFTVTTRAA